MTQASAQEPVTEPRLPDRYLPTAPARDLPEPRRLRTMLGPGVILAAAGLGAGEYILWPSISAQVGLTGLWAAMLGVCTMFFIHMEMERYTIATGETALTGYARLWKPLGPIVAALVVLAHIWPGWATGAATLLTFIVGGGDAAIFAVLGLIATGIAITLSPVVYQTIEKLQMVMVAGIVVFMGVAMWMTTDLQDWTALAEGFGSVGRLPAGIETAVLLGAIVYAGGGAGDLTLSNWIRDKGFGMGSYAPKIVSPFTGQEEARATTGFLFPQDEANLRRWRAWWKVANAEHLIAFFAVTVLAIVSMAVLAYATVFGRDLGEDMDFIRAQGEALSAMVAPWFGVFFWVAGMLFLFSTTVGVIDICGRVFSDAMKNTWLHDSEKWSESRLYITVVWLMIISGSLILLAGFDQPVALLVLSAVIQAVVVAINAVLLTVLNRRALPKSIGLRGYRLMIMVLAALFFTAFTLFTVVEQVAELLGS